MYPNPTSKANGITLNLGKLELGNYNYRIVNTLGQEIQKGTLENQELNQNFKINFESAMNSGCYTLQLLQQNTPIKSLKILIN
jgi:hypothetical protein